MATRISTVKEYFDTLDQRFVQSASAGVDAVFQFEISGAGGGTWHVIVKDGAMSANEGAHPSPSAVVKSSADEYVKIANGDINGLKAVMFRKMTISGNLVLARKMQNMFPTGNI